MGVVLREWMMSPVCRPVSGSDEVGGAAEHDYSGRNAQRCRAGVRRSAVRSMARMPRRGDETFFRIGRVEELIHVIALLDGGNVQSFSFRSPRKISSFTTWSRR